MIGLVLLTIFAALAPNEWDREKKMFTVSDLTEIDYCPKCTSVWDCETNKCHFCDFEVSVSCGSTRGHKLPVAGEIEVNGSDVAGYRKLSQENINVAMEEATKFLDQNVGEYLTKKVHRAGGEVFFVVHIPVGTHYERNIQKFLEFDEQGPYIPLETKVGYVRLEVWMLSGILKDGLREIPFQPLPKYPVRKPRTLGGKFFRLFELAFLTFSERILNGRNLRLYERHRAKNAAFAFKKGPLALPESTSAVPLEIPSALEEGWEQELETKKPPQP